MRQFGCALTSRFVWFPRGRQSYHMNYPENTLIYDDSVGGMLNDEKTKEWKDDSTKEKIMNNLGVTGLDYIDRVKMYNFLKLNETGLLESESIINNNHTKYIEDRIYLKSFRVKKLPYLSS